MLCKKLAKWILCYFLAFLLLYLILFLFFNDNFETKIKDGLKDSKKDSRYSAYYINLLSNNIRFCLKECNNGDKHLNDFISETHADIYIIRSQNKLDNLEFKDYYTYSQSLSSVLTIISRYKLGKNRVVLKEKFFNPIFTGVIKFPEKRILFSFLSTSFLPNAYESKRFRRYLMLRRNFTEFRHKKLPILYLADWRLNFFSYLRWCHYLQIKPVNYIYNLFSLKNKIQVFTSPNNLKVYSITKDELGGVLVDFSLRKH